MAVNWGKVKAGQGAVASQLIKEPLSRALPKAQLKYKGMVFSPIIPYVPDMFCLSAMKNSVSTNRHVKRDK